MPSELFEILGPIGNLRVIVKGGGIRILKVLQRRFGGRNWRKMSGTALVRDVKGEIYEAEIHWFEAHGIGRKLVKVKRSHKGRQKG